MRGLQEFSSYVLDSLRGRPYAATVWGDSAVYGEFFEPGGSVRPARSITVGGQQYDQMVSRDDDVARVDETFNRQRFWFADQGQRRLGRTRVAIIGAGGTGSHVAQLLTYLGVRDFVFVDNDIADETSMNRVVTCTAADIGTPKVILARRLIKSIAPDAAVITMDMTIQTREVIGGLKGADILFGCVDNDGARLVLNEISRAYSIPYLDLGVGISVEGGRIAAAGGRLVVATPDGPCLQCVGEIDVDEARFVLGDPEEQQFAVDQDYIQGLDIAAPSVVSLNAAVAAMAVNEFAVYASGVRPPVAYTELDVIGRAFEMKSQRIMPHRVTKSPGCVSCASKGIGDKAEVERYAQRRPADH